MPCAAYLEASEATFSYCLRQVNLNYAQVLMLLEQGI